MVDVVFPPGVYFFEGSQPGNQALYFPSSLISSKRSSMLRRRFDAAHAMWCNQFNAHLRKPFIKRITVKGTIPDNSSGSFQGEGFIERSFDKGDFMR